LPAHQEVVDPPGTQRPENAVPTRGAVRAIAAPGPDRRQGVAPMLILARAADGLDQAHGVLGAQAANLSGFYAARNARVFGRDGTLGSHPEEPCGSTDVNFTTPI